MTTTNLAEFGNIEREEAGNLLTAYSRNRNVCPYFENTGVQVMMNTYSGNVFLTDENFNVLMLNGDNLEGFYNSPYSGHEGFFEELVDEWNESWDEEDSKWLYQLAKDLNKIDNLSNELITLIKTDFAIYKLNQNI
jgi:hypothetical protein